MNHTTKDENYQREQSRLLVKVVPYLHKFNCFVFHGGTIINLFCTDRFKRYSIDLDGVFVPNEKKLSDSELRFLINKKLSLLRKILLTPENKKKLGLNVLHVEGKTSLNIQGKNPFKKHKMIDVKIEISRNYVGVIEEPYIRRLGKAFREEFDTDCCIHSASDVQLYGGKIGALFGRNTIKDSYDLYLLLNEKVNFLSYKKGIHYNLLAGSKSVANILDMNCDKEPIELGEQIKTLGAENYSLTEHIETKKRIKNIVLEMLNEQDLYYILASSLGVTDQTDYEFKDMRAVIARNALNKHYSIKYPERHKNLIHDFVSRFPLKTNKSKLLYRAYQNHIEKQIKNPRDIHFNIPKSIGRGL